MMKTVLLILVMATLVWGSDSEGKDFSFPEIPGWKQSGEIETYSPQTLFEYINGAADLFLAYDFEELMIVEYQNDRKATLTVDVYRHRIPLLAFGIFSQERLQSATILDIGVQGYREKEFLNFWTGPYYVKIAGFKIEPEDEKALTALARKLAENMGEKGSPPSVLAIFPEEGKLRNSEKFIAKNFLGYSFFLSGFTADYDLSGKKFKLYVMEGANPEDCRNMIQKYLEKIQKPRENLAEGRYTILDPYHGEMDFVWKGKYIWGVLNLDDAVLRSKYLKLFEETLQKN